MNIVHISDDIKQEFQIHDDGTTSVSVYGAAKILCIDLSAFIRNRNIAEKDTTYTKYLSKHGFKIVADRFERVSDFELALAAKYYAYKAKVKSTQAEFVDLVMSTFGFRAWIKNELGITQSPNPAVQEELCPQILPTTSAQDNLRDWGNALIQGVPGTNIHPDTKLPAPIVTCRDLGQYLLERLFFLVGLAEEDPSTWDTPKFRIAAASMAGSPTAKLLPVPNDHRTLGKGFGKTKK